MTIFTGGTFDRAIGAFSTTAVSAAPSAAVRTVSACPGSASFTGSRSGCTGTRVCMLARTSTLGTRQVASVDLDGELLAGSLPNRALALVAEWARLHQDEL